MTKVKHFFDPFTFTLTYVVFDTSTRDAVIIDPLLDYDPQGSLVSYEQFNLVMEFIRKQELTVHYILETHAHADHLSSSQFLQKQFPQAAIAIHENIKEVQKTFKTIFNFDRDFNPDGSQFDLLLKDQQELQAGKLHIKVYHTPGHTPACVSLLIDDNLFTGDALFMPDSGTGRCDFPEGSSEKLYNSIRKLYQLPENIKIYVGHDYQPNGRNLEFQTTIGEEKRSNIQLNEKTTKEDFIQFRNRRDNTLKAPRLLLPSIQVNINAGRLPLAETNGKSYLKIPLNITPLPDTK